jgi:hypothetical protein
MPTMRRQSQAKPLRSLANCYRGEAMSIEPTFTGEIQLAGWSDTHNGGAKITFWLPDAESLEVFKGITSKKGNTAGHRFMAVLVEIGDDEQPVKPEPKPAEKLKGGELSKRAGILCADPAFLQWLSQEVGAPFIESRAAIYLRNACGIQSRAELDHDPIAALTFKREFDIPFSEWMRS